MRVPRMSTFPVLKHRISEATTAIAVLLVSPNARLRQELREKLNSPRWSLQEATSGAEALEHLYEHGCEVLLLDPQLADLEFNEFSAMVGERFPAIQILTVNSQTGQIVVGSTSPTPLSAQLAEMLHRPAEAEPKTHVSDTQGGPSRHHGTRHGGQRHG